MGGGERRGRDSNPEVLADAGFRDRCIAVLPPLRGVLLNWAGSFGGSDFRLASALSVCCWKGNGRGGIRTHEALVMPTHFPGVRLKPLGHPSNTPSALKRRRWNSNPRGPFGPNALAGRRL